MNLSDDPLTQTHDVLTQLREIQNASLEHDSEGKFNLSLRPSLQELEIEEFPQSELFIAIGGCEKSISNDRARGLL